MADFAYIPFGIPGGEQEVAEVAEVIGSGWITTGPRVAEFETAFATYVEYGACAGGEFLTAGLHLALAALRIGQGDEVITTPRSVRRST